MINLLHVSIAYRSAFLALMFGEANFISEQLDLPLPRPIEKHHLELVSVAPPHLPGGPSGVIETREYMFSFSEGAFYKLLRLRRIAKPGEELVETWRRWAEEPSLVDTNGAHRLATRWMGKISIDIGALERKHGKATIQQLTFAEPAGSTNRISLPIFHVFWGKSATPTAQVTVLGATKEVLEIVLSDPSFWRRPALVLKDADELNRVPDPPLKQLEREKPD